MISASGISCTTKYQHTKELKEPFEIYTAARGPHATWPRNSDIIKCRPPIAPELASALQDVAAA